MPRFYDISRLLIFEKKVDFFPKTKLKIKSPKKYFLFGVRNFSWVFRKVKVRRKCDCSGFRGDPGTPYPSTRRPKWSESPDFPVYGWIPLAPGDTPHQGNIAPHFADNTVMDVLSDCTARATLRGISNYFP